MDYRFKLVVPEAKAQRIEDALDWGRYFEYEKQLKEDEEIKFPIKLKDGKLLLLAIRSVKVLGKSIDEEDDFGSSPIFFELYDENNKLLKSTWKCDVTFFRPWVFEYNGDTYTITPVREE